MEGRAIARPDATSNVIVMVARSPLQWRAGQLPGRTATQAADVLFTSVLQWRAGQLPGRTPGWVAGCRPSPPPLQWRAGQLPGRT